MADSWRWRPCVSVAERRRKQPCGRTYVRNGSLIDLQIALSVVRSLVSGSEIYKVAVKVTSLTLMIGFFNQGCSSLCSSRSSTSRPLVREADSKKEEEYGSTSMSKWTLL
jgi:hypothetical protein